MSFEPAKPDKRKLLRLMKRILFENWSLLEALSSQLRFAAIDDNLNQNIGLKSVSQSGAAPHTHTHTHTHTVAIEVVDYLLVSVKMLISTIYRGPWC